MAVLTYDPNGISLSVAGKLIKGFSDGTFVTIARNNDMFSDKTGCDGKTTRVKTNDKSGYVQFVLQQSSASNDDMSAIIAADELDNAGVVPVMVRDTSGRTTASSLSAWFARYPQVDYSKDVSDRTYMLRCDSLDIFVGGN
ncbi:MAG: DUF3277 family protein [Sphingomonas sp.]|nr:MAG: DUF3277 family protein [Sphingomonas sp.]